MKKAKDPTQTSEEQDTEELVKTVMKIATLAQLQKLVDAPAICRFKIDEQEVEVEIKRMTSAVAEQHREIMRNVPPPPWVKERGDYDRLNPAYVKATDLAEKKARNFVVYTCCPAVAASKPGLATVDEIHTFMQGQLSESIIDLIARDCFISGISVEVSDRANFT